MGFTRVVTLDADTMIALGGQNKKTGKANPKQVEGYFLGSVSFDDKKKKDGIGYKHFFQVAEGTIGVWGKTNLDKQLRSVKPGTMLRITHTGFKPTANGDMYTYLVEQDKANVISVDEIVSQQAESAYTADSGSSETYEEAVDEVGVDEDETPMDEVLPAPRAAAARPAPRAADPNRAKAVQDLLNGRSKR